MIDTAEMSTRLTALDSAKKFVDPIHEKYPLEVLENRPHPAPAFSAQARFTETPASQAIDHVLQIADWILKEHNE